MIKLYTDSASYIPMDIQVDYGIQVLQHTFIIDGKEYKENSIQYDDFYRSIDRDKTLPRTRAFLVDELYTLFENDVKQGHKVLMVLLSSKFSDSYQRAVKAAKKVKEVYPRAVVEIVDSKSSCMEEGFAVMAAARAIKANSSFSDAINAARDTIRYTRGMFIPQKLKYLEYDGRIKKSQAFFGDMMGVSPILASHNGEFVLGENNPSRNRAVSKMLEMLKKDIDKFGIKAVVVHHINDFDAADKLVQKVKEITDAQVLISEVGPIIGGRFGSGSVGLTYLSEKEIRE